MDEKLINLLIQAIKSNTDFETLLKEVFSILTVNFNLSDINPNLKVLDVCKECETRKGCVESSKTAIIYRFGIDSCIKEELENAKYLSPQEINMTSIIYYIKTITHEMQHIKQNKILEKSINNDDIEYLVLKLCESDSSFMSTFAYNKFYELHPKERLAEVYAYRLVVSVLEGLGKEYENLLKLVKSECLYEEFYNYYQFGIFGPTNCYLKFFAQKEEYEKFKQILGTKNISFNERIFYGLEISESEYVSKVKEYIELSDDLKSLSKNVNKNQ